MNDLTSKKPLVLVSGCRKKVDGHPYDMSGLKYTQAIVNSSHGLPVILPAMGDEIDGADILASVDGLLLTGSYSNVHPTRYGEKLQDDEMKLDTDRDTTILSLIHEAVKQKVPILAICRGFQELNVAYGGTLHPRVHEVDGLMDHREDRSLPFEAQYAVSHSVQPEKGGLFEEFLGSAPVMVNSIHTQGVKDVGYGLTVEARAEDGLVEAFSVRDAEVFSVGVQWHPEWKSTESAVSTALFKAFGDACRARQQRRN